MVDAWDIVLWSAGNLIAIFIAYRIAHHFKYKVKTQQEITWEKNRESMIWWSLSTIDNETLHFGRIFAALELHNIDFNEWQLALPPGILIEVNQQSIEHEISRLPEFSSALGFMTHQQVMAVRDYLGYSRVFVRDLDQGVYSKIYLIQRARKAKDILNLFPEELTQNEGLQAWNERFNSMDQNERDQYGTKFTH